MAVHGHTASATGVSTRHETRSENSITGEADLETEDSSDFSVNPALSPLAEEVRTGLHKTPKKLSSRFFYDAEGSRIFQEIMHCPDYYLTRSEYEILDTHKAALLQAFAQDKRPFELVELGAGDGLKTKILLTYLAQEQVDFNYAPVDISASALDELVGDIQTQWPDLQINPQHTDYFDALERLSTKTDVRRVVLFLGSNIGNFAPADAVDFYQQLHARLQPGDLVLTGFDLQKHPAIIHAAYNDRQGLTKAFNLNLLRRINYELDANFNLVAFDHYEIYNPETGEARSYLVSQKAQVVNINALDMTVPFDYGEIIHTEISRKFTRAQIEQLAQQTSFSVTGWFTDCKGYFVDVVFEK